MMEQMAGESFGEELQIVVFRLGTEEYGVEISGVREIVRATTLTNVPGAPPGVDGVVNLRGRVLPVINLKKRLCLQDDEDSFGGFVMVVQIDKQHMGLEIDAAVEVRKIQLSNIDEPPDVIRRGLEGECFSGVAKIGERLIILLDLERLLGAPSYAEEGGE